MRKASIFAFVIAGRTFLLYLITISCADRPVLRIAEIDLLASCALNEPPEPFLPPSVHLNVPSPGEWASQ